MSTIYTRRYASCSAQKPHSYVISVSVGKGCYRHIRIDGGATLYDLHEAIIDAFAFSDDHAHAFFMDNRAWSEEDAYYSPIIEDVDFYTDEISLNELGLVPGTCFLYIFDFGSEWRFACKVLRVLDEATGEVETVRSVGEPPSQYETEEED